MYDHGHELKRGEGGWEGVWRAEGNKVGGNWDNSNSIINKIHLKKERTNKDS